MSVTRCPQGRFAMLPWCARRLPAAAVALATATAIADVEPIGVRIGHEVEATDNVARVDLDPQEDVIHEPFVDLDLGYRSKPLVAAADYRLQGRYFQNSSFANDQIFTGNAFARFGAFDDRLALDVSHDRNQTLRDVRAPDNRDNRQEVQQLAAGAAWTFGRTVDVLRLSARAVRSDAEREPIDADRYIAGAQYTHLFSPSRRGGVSLQWFDTHYDNPLLRDFVRVTANIDGGLTHRNGEIEGSIGYNRFRRSGGDWSGGLALSLGVTWNLGTRGELRVNGSRQVTDQIGANRQGLAQGLDQDLGLQASPNELVNDGELFESSQLAVRYRWSGRRFTFGGQLEFNLEDFESPRDEQRIRASVVAGYDLTRRLRGQVSCSATLQEFTDEGREDQTWDAVGRLDYELGSRTRLGGGLRYGLREVDGTGEEYEVLGLFASISREL